MVNLNNSLRFILSAAICFQLTLALHCKIGWPVIFGSDNWDGDTEVTTWAETPVDGMWYIGGKSKSTAFTEEPEGTCDVKGCAFVTTWVKTNERFNNRLIYNNVQSIINMEYNIDSGNTVFLFMQASDSN